MKVFQRTVALAAALGFLFAPVAFAQTPAQPAAPAAPRKLISPYRGDATVEYTKPVTKRAGANIETTIVIKNTSPGPLAGFRLEESWADGTGNLAGGDVYRHPRPLMPGEIEVRGNGDLVRLDSIPGYIERHSVRPGLTGLSQVYAPRDTPRVRKFRLDSIYVRNATFCLDVFLVAVSFWITFRGRWEVRARKF